MALITTILPWYSEYMEESSEFLSPGMRPLEHPKRQSQLPEFVEQSIATYKDLEPTTWEILTRIRKEVEKKYPDQFPEACCDLIIQHVMDHRDLGLQIVAGTFKSEGESVEHVWAYDAERRVYIDASADQFPEFSGNPIIVIPKKRLKELGYKKSFIKIILAHLHLGRNI